MVVFKEQKTSPPHRYMRRIRTGLKLESCRFWLSFRIKFGRKKLPTMEQTVLEDTGFSFVGRTG